jgi:NAD(P)H-dependent FMN reductase
VTRIAIILGSTRPGRRGEAVAKWAYAEAVAHGGAEYELVDLADHDLPLLDEPMPPSQVAAGRAEYTKPHTRAWSAKIASFDGYVFVTPEYNHATSAVLKNAIDYLFGEWNNKAAGFIGYGAAGGARAVEMLRLVMGELMVADVRAQLALSVFTDWEAFTTFKPTPDRAKQLHAMLDQVVAWGQALAPLRTAKRP